MKFLQIATVVATASALKIDHKGSHKATAEEREQALENLMSTLNEMEKMNEEQQFDFGHLINDAKGMINGLFH